MARRTVRRGKAAPSSVVRVAAVQAAPVLLDLEATTA